VRLAPVLTANRAGFNQMGTPADGVVPCEVGARLHYQGARGENPCAAGLKPESSYVDGLAAAACSKIFTALPTSATPKITNVALVPGSAPQ
jgi:hypothetical protein